MKKIFINLAVAMALVAPLGMPMTTSAATGNVAVSQCTNLSLVSGTNTQTAGWTAVNPLTDVGGLTAGNYSPGTFSNAVAANLNPTSYPTLVPGIWTDPSAGSFAGSGAVWISDVAAAPGDTGGEGVGTEDQWRLFKQDFSVPFGAAVSPVTINFTADNAVSVYLNGALIGDTSADVTTYGPVPSPLPHVFANTYSATFTPVAGQTNSLEFVVRNSNYPVQVNPTGLLYSAQGQYCVPPSPQANSCNFSSAPLGYTLVVGTTGSDKVTLVPFSMFLGKNGNDKITAGDGNYIICEGAGNNTITLGNGNSVITTGSGDNTITTGNGNQYIVTGAGNDKITTGSGNETINAGNGNNTVKVGGGTGSIVTGSGNDSINGGTGFSTCNAGNGTNTVSDCNP